MRAASVLAAGVLAAAIAGCAQSPNPYDTVNSTTTAVYDRNVAATTSHLDAAAGAQFTGATLSQISDRMHALGAYRGLRALNADAKTGRYDYAAQFDKGTLLVQVRVDADGKLGGYFVSDG